MTSEFILAHGEEFLQCPYNTAHQITNARFITHLDKCRKAYMKTLTVDGHSSLMGVCKYNSTHHMPKLELKIHEQRCSDASHILNFMAHTRTSEASKFYDQRRQENLERERGSKGSREEKNSSRGRNERKDKAPQRRDFKQEATSSNTNDWDIEEEDWEAESNGYQAGYDPNSMLRTKHVMYNPQGLTKSERRLFRSKLRTHVEIRDATGVQVDLPIASEFESKLDLKLFRDADAGAAHRSNIKQEEPGEMIDSDEEFEVVDYANQAAPPKPQEKQRDNNSQRFQSSTTSTGSSSNDRVVRGIPNDGEDEPWPYGDSNVDYFSDDSMDFKGFDPYA